ncbi:MAG: hypothetical protein O2887_16760 [Bacteroidetes bacterium]|nr:hypothetical protein [Bacteroidota bacterium]MDA1122113.1 hypothetical protein [Bacteroidota bacterium]
MKKLKQKAGSSLLKEIGVGGDEKEDNTSNQNTNPSNSTNSSNSSNSSNAQNNRGGGLKMAPPDVMMNISDARASLETKSYSQVRFAIQEAMRGVELKIGEQILESFPNLVSGMDYDKDQDQIITSGIGFVGLVIGRNYTDDDQGLEAMINNNSMMISSVNLYLTNPAYMQSDESDGMQYKRVTVQGNRALIQYSDDSGYQLSVPLGQSTLFSLKCINFESEEDVVAASDNFDLAEIKSLLGEN